MVPQHFCMRSVPGPSKLNVPVLQKQCKEILAAIGERHNLLLVRGTEYQGRQTRVRRSSPLPRKGDINLVTRGCCCCCYSAAAAVSGVWQPGNAGRATARSGQRGVRCHLGTAAWQESATSELHRGKGGGQGQGLVHLAHLGASALQE